MIENVTQYVLGVCIEYFIDKLNKVNDSIKEKV